MAFTQLFKHTNSGSVSLTTPLVTLQMKDLDSLLAANGPSSLHGSPVFAVPQFILPLLSLDKRPLPEQKGKELPSLTLSRFQPSSSILLPAYPYYSAWEGIQGLCMLGELSTTGIQPSTTLSWLRAHMQTSVSMYTQAHIQQEQLYYADLHVGLCLAFCGYAFSLSILMYFQHFSTFLNRKKLV